MIRHQSWSPDTCGCRIEQLVDDHDESSKPENFTITMGQIYRKCKFHESVDDKNLYGIIYENKDSEQKRKNGTYKHFLETETLVGVSEFKSDGSLQLKDGIQYSWVFDDDRNLVVALIGYAPNSNVKRNVQDELDAKFGKPGLVVYL